MLGIVRAFLSRIHARIVPIYLEFNREHADSFMASRPDLVFREVTGDNPNHRYFAVRLRSMRRRS
jgi:hypothetical protein